MSGVAYCKRCNGSNRARRLVFGYCKHCHGAMGMRKEWDEYWKIEGK